METLDDISEQSIRDTATVIREKIKKNVRRLYGVDINLDNADHMIVAAYNLARWEDHERATRESEV